MADFQWHTGDEDDWPVEAEEVEEGNRQRPSWQFPLIIIVILALTAAGLYSLFNRRAEEAQELIKDDVRRTHELVMTAADDGDYELFTTFLSGASATWLELQIEAVKQGNFDQAPWLDLRLDERPYLINDITLAPTLDEATVTYTRWYQNEDGNEFPLLHMVVYRRGGDRWLLAPPTADFWGREATLREAPITLVYPTRDEAQATRLAVDLAGSLTEVCAGLPDANCPEEWELTVTFSTDLEHKLFPSLIEGPGFTMNLDLPTPSLLGLPLDDAGYQALLQGYHSRLLREAPLSLTRFLKERPEYVPPVIQADNLAVLPNAEMTFSCNTGNTDRHFWHLFRYNLAQGRWQVNFSRTYTDEDNGFAYALPGGENVIIQDYIRQELLTSRLFLWRDDETYLIREQTTNFDNALSASLFPANIDPSGRLIAFGSISEGSNGEEEEPQWLLLDSTTCVPGQGCDKMQSILSVPLWSPDGSQTLMTDPVYLYEIYEPVHGELYRAGRLGQDPVRIGEGITPFWLSDTTYGYSRLNDEEAVEVILAGTADDEPRLWFDTADLIPLVPEERNSERMGIWEVWVNPADPDMVVIMATLGDFQVDGPYDYFIIRGTGSQPQIEWVANSVFPASTSHSPFSPDGRFLLLSQRGQAIQFLDLETGEPIPYDDSLGFFSGWTPDGRYYAQRRDQALTLTSVENQAQIRVQYDFSTCSGIQWLE